MSRQWSPTGVSAWSFVVHLICTYVNELPSLVSSSLLMFADDIKLYWTIQCPEDCLQLQEDINILQQWSDKWLLSFNLVKCKILHIGNNVTNCIHHYTLNRVDLELLGDIRDLGIQMDSKLQFHVHMNSVANKANRILCFISKVFECKDSNVMQLYKSLVCPILEYSNVIWSPNYIMDKQKVEAIQCQATKMIFTYCDLPYHD